MSIGNYAGLPGQPSHSIDRSDAMALRELFVCVQVNDVGVVAMQFGADSLG